MYSHLPFERRIEYLITEACGRFEGTVSIRGRSITNSRFGDDIDLVARKAEVLVDLTSRLEERAKRFDICKSVQKKKQSDEAVNQRGRSSNNRPGSIGNGDTVHIARCNYNR